MTTLSTLQTRLTEAETAYHSLMTGTKVVRVSFGIAGITEYKIADADKLASYIQFLQTQITNMSTGQKRRPISVYF